MGAITNADYRNINTVDTLSASSSLRRLRDLGLLELKGKSSQTYYIPGKTIALKEVALLNVNPLSTESALYTSPLPGELNSLPSDLVEELKNLSPRISPNKAKYLIVKICEIRPFKLPELAHLFKRNAHYMRLLYLMPLIKSGELQYVFPHQPNHPQQAYQTKQS